MKKTLTTLALILGLALTGMAQMSGGGLFQRGDMAKNIYFRNGPPIILPPEHGSDSDHPAVAPLGGGVLVLGALGAAYLVGKKRREE